MDLRGLAALAERIFRLLVQPEAIEPNAETALGLYAISSILNRRGHAVRARTLYERSGYRIVDQRTNARYERITWSTGRVLMVKPVGPS